MLFNTSLPLSDDITKTSKWVIKCVCVWGGAAWPACIFKSLNLDLTYSMWKLIIYLGGALPVRHSLIYLGGALPVRHRIIYLGGALPVRHSFGIGKASVGKGW